MKGLELSKQYFETYGRPMLAADFPELSDKIAAGLMGSGSECFGYDDEISQDHDFEIGFCLFLPGEDVVDRQCAFRLERAYAKLPGEFMGFRKSALNPVGGSRHGVIRAGDFLMDKIGSPDGYLTAHQWLTSPEQGFFELQKGSLFLDDSGFMQTLLGRTAGMPEDIRLKKLAGELLMMAQSGQYNYLRCVRRGDSGAAALAAGEFVKAALHTCFLLNGAFMPYYKWQFRALAELPSFSELAEPLSYLINSDNEAGTAEEKYTLMEDLAGVFIAELMDQEITKASCGDLEKHAYSVNDHIQDGEIRNLHILAGV
ncbi:MAG: DUF4037 domain-containing protein [Lachnospiraceae bacterium]|nr:DUF4037 domain-containing protein [Lachnospiraceae bacterium]